MSTLSTLAVRERTPSRALLGATLAGLAVAGLAVQWVVDPALFGGFGFPPGILYVLAAGAIAWLDRRSAWSPAAAVGLALWIVVGGLVGGQLTAALASPNVGVVAGNVVMVAGLAAATGAGALTIAANRRAATGRAARPLARTNPARAAVLVTVAGLAAAAIGDGAPEGFTWDGPGPALFAVLAVLVAVVPGRSMVLLGVLMSVAFAGAALTIPASLAKLGDPSDVVVFGFAVLQVAGFAVAAVAGTVAAALSRTAPGS